MVDQPQDSPEEKWLDEPWTQERRIGRTRSFNAVHEISAEEAWSIALLNGASDEGTNWVDWWANRRAGRSSNLEVDVYELPADDLELLFSDNPHIGKPEGLKTFVDPETIRRWGRPIPQFGMLTTPCRTERGQMWPPDTQFNVIMPSSNIQHSASSSPLVQGSLGAGVPQLTSGSSIREPTSPEVDPEDSHASQSDRPVLDEQEDMAITEKSDGSNGSQASKAMEGLGKQMMTEPHHSHGRSSSKAKAEKAKDLKVFQSPRTVKGHNTNEVETTEAMDNVPGESGRRKKRKEERNGEEGKADVNMPPLDVGNVDDNQESQALVSELREPADKENKNLSTPSPSSPSLNPRSQKLIPECIGQLRHTISCTVEISSAHQAGTSIHHFADQAQVEDSLRRLGIRILTAERKLSSLQLAQNSVDLQFAKNIYVSEYTRLRNFVPDPTTIDNTLEQQDLFKESLKFICTSATIISNHYFPGYYGGKVLSIDQQQAETILGVSEKAILTAKHDLSNCEIFKEDRGHLQHLVGNCEELLTLAATFQHNPEHRARFQELVVGSLPWLEATESYLDKNMSIHPQLSLPLPVLPEGWSAENNFKAIGTLSAATQRSIEPVGPHFLAHARRARHQRTFSEDDRIQAQENVKMVEDDDSGEISETEDPMMLSRDAKDWKGQDHYAVLGLSKYRYKATEEQIKRAHRKKVLRHHPDKKAAAGNTEDDSFFKCIQKASEILLDPVKRRQFDSVDEAADVEPPTKRQTKDGKFYKLWGSVFKAEGRFSKVPQVPKFGDENSTEEEVEHFYNFFYNFDSWRSFEYQDEDVPDDNENRDQKRHVEKKNNNARKKKKTEDSARLRKLLDDASAGDERIKKFRQEANASRNKKRLEKEAAEKKAIEDAQAKKAAEAQAAKEAEEAAKAEREQGKKAKEAAKAAVKKNRRVLKGSVKDANYFVGGEPPAAAIDSVLGDVELIQGKISPDETAALASKLNGLKIADEIKTVWQTEVKRLVDAGKIKDSDIKALA
ncbi:hypothetical protein B7494_g7606 [Chlorociboria aeruginascens]|nr:hypothetical protein B7494_g7606 [Chlorociboria aeruginascens]